MYGSMNDKIYEFYIEDEDNFKDVKDDLPVRIFTTVGSVLKLITYPIWVILICLYEVIYILTVSKDVEHIGGLYRIVFGKYIPRVVAFGFWLSLDIITVSKYDKITNKVRESIITMNDILKDDVYSYVLANTKFRKEV